MIVILYKHWIFVYIWEQDLITLIKHVAHRADTIYPQSARYGGAADAAEIEKW